MLPEWEHEGASVRPRLRVGFPAEQMADKIEAIVKPSFIKALAAKVVGPSIGLSQCLGAASQTRVFIRKGVSKPLLAELHLPCW